MRTVTATDTPLPAAELPKNHVRRTRRIVFVVIGLLGIGGLAVVLVGTMAFTCG